MATWQVVDRVTNKVEYGYSADAPVEWPDYPFSSFNHIKQEEPVQENTIEIWRIYVGAFFDRFGDQRMPILLSDDSVIQAGIRDCSIRKYIDLTLRRTELQGFLTYIQSKGFSINIPAILDTKPTADETWQPSIA